jgi:sec-independent protein translocase protein TatB
MSGIGFWELIILFLIGLIVLGPERLPRVASQLGSWLGQARRMTRVMRRQLEDELNLEKEIGIRPPRLSSPAPTPPVSPRKEYDDTYSAAHDAGSVGTGVGERKDDEIPAPDATAGKEKTAAERPAADSADEPDKQNPSP